MISSLFKSAGLQHRSRLMKEDDGMSYDEETN